MGVKPYLQWNLLSSSPCLLCSSGREGAGFCPRPLHTVVGSLAAKPFQLLRALGQMEPPEFLSEPWRVVVARAERSGLHKTQRTKSQSHNAAGGKKSQNKQLRSVLTQGPDCRWGRGAQQRVPSKTQPALTEFSAEFCSANPPRMMI